MAAPDPDRLTDLGKRLDDFQTKQAAGAARQAPSQSQIGFRFATELFAGVVGGGGIAPLDGGDPSICELRKMYFLPDARGHGLGEQLLRRCLDAARGFGFATCYLETLARMDDARKLYRKFGFQPLCAPMGNTGHFGCDSYYALDLTAPAP